MIDENVVRGVHKFDVAVVPGQLGGRMCDAPVQMCVCVILCDFVSVCVCVRARVQTYA